MHDEVGNLAYQPYGTEGQYINSVSRGGLNIQLLKLADENPDVHLFFNHKCIDIDFKTGETTYLNEAGEKVVQKADYVVGSDGAFSHVYDCV